MVIYALAAIGCGGTAGKHAICAPPEVALDESRARVPGKQACAQQGASRSVGEELLRRFWTGGTFFKRDDGHCREWRAQLLYENPLELELAHYQEIVEPALHFFAWKIVVRAKDSGSFSYIEGSAHWQREDEDAAWEAVLLDRTFEYETHGPVLVAGGQELAFLGERWFGSFSDCRHELVIEQDRNQLPDDPNDMSDDDWPRKL